MFDRTITAAPLNAARMVSDNLSVALERLSSGKRINTASDDAAGLSISETLRTQVEGSAQAGRNVQDALNMTQIAEAGVQDIFPVIQRMRQLIIQAGNTDLSDQDLQSIQDELDAQKQAVVDAFVAAHDTNIAYADPSGSRIEVYQVGANQGQTVTVNYNGLRDTMAKFVTQAFGYTEMYNSQMQKTLAAQMGVTPAPVPTPALQASVPKKLDVTVKPNGITDSLQVVDDFLNGGPGTPPPVVFPATNGLLLEAGYLGAAANQLQASYNNVINAQENQSSAESRIEDADMAGTMTRYAKDQILENSSMAMIAQANFSYSMVTSLVKPLGSH